MGQRASTDFDERNSHDNSILNIIEGRGLQILFQNDKDWHYRTEERRWVTLNDKSSWRKVEVVKGKSVLSTFHVRSTPSNRDLSISIPATLNFEKRPRHDH